MIRNDPPPEEIEDIEALEEGEGKEVRWLRTAPGWVISLGLHLLVVFALTFFYIQQYVFVDDSTVTVNIRAPEGPKVSEVEAPKTEEEEKPEEDETQGERGEFSADESFDPADAGSDAVAEAEGGSTMGVFDPTASATGRVGSRRPTGPKKARPKMSGTDRSIRSALKWLARHQREDGSWSATRFHEACGRHGYGESCARNEFEGNEQYDVGVTSLALLAFLGAGCLPSNRDSVFAASREAEELGALLESSPTLTYGEVVKRACKFLMRSQDPSGRLGPPVDRHVYNHVLGAAALAEAYGQTGMWLLRAPAEKAIRWIEEARSPGRGWRYGFRGRDTDSSVTGWAILALRSAETAGIEFDRSAFDDIRRWFDRATVSASIEPRLLGRNPGDPPGTWILTGYRNPRDAGNLVSVAGLNEHYHYTPSSSATMVLSSFLMDGKLGPKGEKLIETILDFPPVAWTPGDKDSYRPVDFYYWYHATYALYHATSKEDARWTRWGEAVKSALIDTQNLKDAEGRCQEGSWEPIDRWSCEGGRVYATAMAALTLEVHYRYPRIVGIEKKERALRVEEKP